MQRKTVNLCGSVKEKEAFCSYELGLTTILTFTNMRRVFLLFITVSREPRIRHGISINIRYQMSV